MSDLISREDVLRLAESGKLLSGSFGERAKDIISSIPTAEPKVGKWIEVTSSRGGHECSHCHDYAPSYQAGSEYLSKYCPNCGAKMERSE